ncbi:MAG TPA: hypothetical protein DEF51_44545 [Myxococcales bacterium]|nr:hypothetical protein [Myxococcales bacterium]
MTPHLVYSTASARISPSATSCVTVALAGSEKLQSSSLISTRSMRQTSTAASLRRSKARGCAQPRDRRGIPAPLVRSGE